MALTRFWRVVSRVGDSIHYVFKFGKAAPLRLRKPGRVGWKLVPRGYPPDNSLFMVKIDIRIVNLTIST